MDMDELRESMRTWSETFIDFVKMDRWLSHLFWEETSLHEIRRDWDEERRWYWMIPDFDQGRTRSLAEVDAFGRKLMSDAFKNPDLLDLGKLQPENQDSFVEGYRFLGMGLTGAIRNVFSHGDEHRRTPEECFEMLLMVNWMLRGLART